VRFEKKTAEGGGCLISKGNFFFMEVVVKIRGTLTYTRLIDEIVPYIFFSYDVRNGVRSFLYKKEFLKAVWRLCVSACVRKTNTTTWRSTGKIIHYCLSKKKIQFFYVSLYGAKVRNRLF